MGISISNANYGILVYYYMLISQIKITLFYQNLLNESMCVEM